MNLSPLLPMALLSCVVAWPCFAAESWQRLCPEAPAGVWAGLSLGGAQEPPLFRFENTTGSEFVARVELSFIGPTGKQQRFGFSSGLRSQDTTDLLHHGMTGMKKLLSSSCRIWKVEAAPSAPPVASETTAPPSSPASANAVVPSATVRIRGPRCSRGRCRSEPDFALHPPEGSEPRREAERKEVQLRDQQDAQRRLEQQRDLDRRDQDRHQEELRNVSRQADQREHQLEEGRLRDQRDEDLREDRDEMEQQLDTLRQDQLRQDEALDFTRHPH